MSTLRLRAVLVAALAMLATVGAIASAGPAAAHATISIKTPGPDEVLRASGVTVAAQVVLGSHPTGETKGGKVDMTLDQLESNRPQIKASAEPNASGSVAFPVNLPYNGRYKVFVSTTWTHSSLVISDPNSGTAKDERTFAVEVPPANPTDVKVAVDAGSRATTVTWKANTEPDLLFYVIQRARGASTEFSVVGKATEAKFVDATTAEAGGEYHYQVVAVRKGINADEGISSDPSALSPASTATVADPPAPPTTAGTATTEAAGGGAATATATTGAGPDRSGTTLPANNPGALTTSGTVDLKGFTAVQSRARSSVRRPAEPDPGFQSTLPFAPGEGAEGEGELEEGGELGEVAADSPQFRELGTTEEGADRRQTMLFLAGGLLTTVLLMHVLWVKSEVDRVPLEALAPEGPRPAAGPHGGWAEGAAAGRHRKGAPLDPVTEWFVPERLGTADAPAERQKVGAGA